MSILSRLDRLERRRGSSDDQAERRREQASGLAAEVQRFGTALTEAAADWTAATLTALPALHHWAWSLRFDAEPLSLRAVIGLRGSQQ